MNIETLEKRQLLTVIPAPAYAPGPESATVGNTLFTANSSGQLLKSNLDGSHQQVVATFQAEPTWLTSFNGKLYFDGNTKGNGSELWISDGTAKGTGEVANIYEGQTSSDPHNFMIVDNQLYFLATHAAPSIELYTTDGTQAGTKLIAGESQIVGVSNILVQENTLYFESIVGNALDTTQ